MWVAIAVVGILALAGLGMALGVSLGRYGDREDEQQYRNQVAEGMNQLHDRLRKLEDDEDDTQPPEGPWVK